METKKIELTPELIAQVAPISDTKPLIEAGKALTQVLAIPDGYHPVAATPLQTTLVKLEKIRLDKPRFLTAKPVFHDPVAFAEYVVRFADASSRIFYDLKAMVFTAVLDYHRFPGDSHTGVEVARFGDHVATLQLRQSPEWGIWATKSEQAMGQNAFAEFLEDNARDIVEPSIAEMMGVATGLAATSNATFRSAINQENGTVNFQFDENVAGTVKGSNKAIPTAFKIGIRPFMGSQRYPVECKLRYRLKEGSLALHYKALQLDPIIEASIEGIAATLRDSTKLPVALGQANEGQFKQGF